MKNIMDPKETVYYGIENKENLLCRKDLADLIEIPYLVSYFFRRDFHHEAPNNYKNGKLPYYYYKIVDKNGERTTIEIGDFEITEIEPEINYFGRLDYRNIKVFDKQFGVYRTFKSKTADERFIIKDLFFLIDKLKFIPNWDILTEYLNIPALEAKIIKLENKIKLLQESIANSQGE